MKVRKAISKIVALGTGALLTGATILSATAAADLADYPGMFIEDGKFDGLLVVGDNAAAEDVVGITNIAMGLQSVSVKEESIDTGAAKAIVSGDSAAFERGSDILELGEDPGNVKGTFTEDDLLLLASGTVSTSKGSTVYNQYLKFDETGIDPGSVLYGLNDDDEADDYWTLTEGAHLFTYELEFEEGLESDVDADDNLEDIEDETIVMLGSSFSITQADLSGSDITIEMLGGDVTDTLEEGETKTYTIGDKEYEVKLLIVADTTSSAKFQINGETTDKLEEGETDKMSDGLEIGIRDVLPNEAQEEAGGDIVEFYLGANKVTLRDTNYEIQNGGTVEVKEENIEDASVEIIATNVTSSATVASVVSINRIVYNLTLDSAGGNPFVADGGGLRDMLDETEGMLTEGWDIEFHGLFATDTVEIKFDSSGDDKYKLDFTSGAGKEYSINFLDNSDGHFIAGKETDDYLHWVEPSKALTGHAASAFANHSEWGTNFIDEDETFVLTDQTGTLADNNDYTYVLKFESLDTDNNELSFSDESDGATKKVIYTITQGTDGGSGRVTVGGKDFGVWINETNERIVVDLNGDAGDGDSVDIVTKGGAIIDLGTADADISMGAGMNITIVTLASEFDGDGILGGGLPSEVNVSFVARSGNELGISSVFTENPDTDAIFSMVSPDDNDDYEFGRDPYGAFYSLYNPSDSDQTEELTIEYPMAQIGASLFIVSGETSSGTSGTGSAVTQTVQKISVGAVKLASEVSNVKAQNAVVVGGPCANPAAADLLGNPANCVEGFQTGHAMIKLFENSGNVAMLVAGMTAEDTRRAALVVAQYEDYADELVGDEVDVTGTSLSDIDVGTPMMEEEVMEDDEEPADEE